jgi:hypothetical protein
VISCVLHVLAVQTSGDLLRADDRCEMSEALCYFSPRKARLIVALISFGGFFLWILFGSYSYLPASHRGSDVHLQTAHHDDLVLHAQQRSVAIGADWRSHGRRLLSVNESDFNCSLAHLVLNDGKKVKLDDNGVSAQISRIIWTEAV